MRASVASGRIRTIIGGMQRETKSHFLPFDLKKWSLEEGGV